MSRFAGTLVKSLKSPEKSSVLSVSKFAGTLERSPKSPLKPDRSKSLPLGVTVTVPSVDVMACNSFAGSLSASSTLSTLSAKSAGTPVKLLHCPSKSSVESKSKLAGTLVRSPKSPEKSSVLSVSRFGNSLFTAVATWASVNWVSVLIKAAKSANATAKVFESESVITKFVFVPSIPKDVTVVFESVNVSLKLLKSTLTLPPFSKVRDSVLVASLKVKPVSC